jgi:hypothetical protein
MNPNKQWALKGGFTLAGLVLAAGAASAADPSLIPYTAVYSVEYKGKDLGTSEFKLTYDAGRDVYEFSSQVQAKGFLKLARPNPVIERSEFRSAGNRLVPIEFWYEDGSRKGDGNLHIAFDWDRHVATVTGENGRREVALQDGALDRATIEVALMRDLNANGKPGHYLLADEDDVKPYDFTDAGETTTATGLGPITTRAFAQHRENSSRATTIWVAPKLRYLPARIERRKDGEVQTAFTLSSVQGITPQ